MNIQIAQLERDLPDGTVTVIHWSATEQDGEHSARAYGSASLERNEDSADFIPFDELTEEKVIEEKMNQLTEDDPQEAARIAATRARRRRALKNKFGKRQTIRTSGRGAKQYA